MTLTDADRYELRDLIRKEINRLEAARNKRGQHDVMVATVDPPVKVSRYRLDDLRWQKIEVLLAILEKLR